MRELVYDVKEVRTIRELLQYCSQYSEDPAFVLKKPTGGVYKKSFRDLQIEVMLLSTYLNSLGLENKKIAIIGNNCYEWALSYLAVCSGTGIAVPIDPKLSCKEVSEILKLSECSAVIYTKAGSEIIENCKNAFRNITPIPAEGFRENLVVAERLIENGNISYDNHKIDPDALGEIRYTTDKNGHKKGVMLSQYNICSTVVSARKRIYFDQNDRAISILPLHNIDECVLGFLLMLYSGTSIAFSESLEALPEDFTLYKPTVSVSSPLLLEYIYLKMLKNLHTPDFLEIYGDSGGQLRLVICNTAFLCRELSAAYQSLGITVLTGCGLAETASLYIGNSDFQNSCDTAGKPMSGVSVKIVEQDGVGVGEIAVKGPNVMLGYYKNFEETKRIFRDDWFYTGDFGKTDQNGNYIITRRTKYPIVAPDGNKIYPEEIEDRLKKSKFIKDCMILGRINESAQVFLEAFLYPDFEEANRRLSEKGITPDDKNYAAELKALFGGIVKETNSQFPRNKRIRRFVIKKCLKNT